MKDLLKIPEKEDAKDEHEEPEKDAELGENVEGSALSVGRVPIAPLTFFQYFGGSEVNRLEALRAFDRIFFFIKG